MDGLTAAKRIAKSFPLVPILINTIHKSEYVDSEAKIAGVRQVISKGDSGALLRAIEILLTGNPTLPRPAENKATP
jgi:DNA-binding NarL/FixJ family response regulator